MFEKPTSTQAMSLLDVLKKESKLDVYDFDSDKAVHFINNQMTLKQYKFVLALLFNKKWMKLYKVLDGWGIPKK